MEPLNDKLWKAFEELAKRYPDDNGVRMTADLARWLAEHQRLLASKVPSTPKDE